jgi:hypothetical protein
MYVLSVPILSESDFDRARGAISDFSQYCRYEDWLDSRHGRCFGFSISGVDTRLVCVPLDDFLHWCGERGLHPSEAAFDRFASSVEHPRADLH